MGSRSGGNRAASAPVLSYCRKPFTYRMVVVAGVQEARGSPTMNQTDQETIATIALLAALADGTQTQEETAQLAEVFKRLGMTQLDEEARRASAGTLALKDLAPRLSGEEARKMAYDTALAVIHSDGAANP